MEWKDIPEVMLTRLTDALPLKILPSLIYSAADNRAV